MTEIRQALERRFDWRARLTAYMAEVARRRFRPGQHDCALFAAGAVEAMTGTDLAARWRGKYISLGAGRAMLRAKGFADHVEIAAAILPEVPPALAQVGDLAVLQSDFEDDPAALGVVQGAFVYALNLSGLVLTSRLNIERAFRV